MLRSQTASVNMNQDRPKACSPEHPSESWSIGDDSSFLGVAPSEKSSCDTNHGVHLQTTPVNRMGTALKDISNTQCRPKQTSSMRRVCLHPTISREEAAKLPRISVIDWALMPAHIDDVANPANPSECFELHNIAKAMVLDHLRYIFPTALRIMTFKRSYHKWLHGSRFAFLQFPTATDRDLGWKKFENMQEKALKKNGQISANVTRSMKTRTSSAKTNNIQASAHKDDSSHHSSPRANTHFLAFPPNSPVICNNSKEGYSVLKITHSSLPTANGTDVSSPMANSIHGISLMATDAHALSQVDTSIHALSPINNSSQHSLPKANTTNASSLTASNTHVSSAAGSNIQAVSHLGNSSGSTHTSPPTVSRMLAFSPADNSKVNEERKNALENAVLIAEQIRRGTALQKNSSDQKRDRSEEPQLGH